MQNRIDLDTLPTCHLASTYLFEVECDGMINIGIYPKDNLIADRSFTACHKDIVIALIDDGFIAKQFSGW